MNEREALKLALEALEYPGPSWPEARQPAITAIKEALAKPAQEPVRREQKMFMEEQEFYTTPPQRTWIGLTDDDTQEAWDAMKDYDDFDTYTKFIEAKLKEKNA